MFAKMIAAGALVTMCGFALASDASYDQEQIRKGHVTLVEGALQGARESAVKSEAAPAVARDCGCEHPNA